MSWYWAGMTIDEFDEYQGITREMVDSYLNHKGWCNLPDPEIRLLKPSYVQITFSMGLVRAVEQIAEIERRTAQALLRDMAAGYFQQTELAVSRLAQDAESRCAQWLLQHGHRLPQSHEWTLSAPAYGQWLRLELS